MAKEKSKTSPDENEEGVPLCPECGSQMVEEDGETICPNCDKEIDFFGGEEE